MSIFNGLYLYEIVLLVLGVILFLVIIFAFIYQIRHGKKVAGLAVFLLVAIVMIAYPSVQQVQFKDGLLTIVKYTRQLQQNPTDTAARQSLQQTVAQLAPRVSSGTPSAGDLATVAAAQYALGDEPAASTNLQKALSINPQTPTALALQQRITTVDRISKLTAAVQASPADSAAASELHQSVAAASALHLANPKAILQVARAQAVLGQPQQAAANTAKVLAIQPAMVEAQHLQQQLQSARPVTPPGR